ncbi:TPA: group II intron reverse transcriptase/maturase [Streptococcus suis]|nr:group II intron reverse transcriptase/maturase [Streptococcus suis]
MNDKHSTTAPAEKLSHKQLLAKQWKSIDWKRAEQEVNRLQIRIVKATQAKHTNTVKRLQYLLTHSFYAKALAVRRVTTNKGKKTAGIDGELWTTPAQKMEALLSLTDKGYKASPLRRVYIDKKGKKKKRPLGIPTMYDRAMQALYALALEPVAETTADTKSFGFRKGRSCQDACEYIFTALSRKASPQWILEGDIKGCFDNISHDWLLENIPMDKSILKQFLKAGFVFKGELFPTEDGTPQGGIISPILANMALDGLQQVLSDRFHTNRLGKIDLRFKNSHKVNLVRYADDFIVTAATQEIALEAKELIREFLLGRGLELSEEKTLVTHINDGFDLLGWNFRKYKGKLIVKPSKNSIQTVIGKFSETILKRGKAWEQEVLIMKLNQQIRGWTNYHQSVCASEAFSYLDYHLYELLWRWAKRRHPKKGQWWVSTKYWHRRGNRSWVFASGDKELIRVDHTAIVRHTKVRENANPYLDIDYLAQRTFNHGMKRLTGRFKLVWKKQDGRCHHCGLPMELGEDREIFFKVPKSKGGVEEVDNMAYVHSYCQRLFIESRSKE